MIMGKTSPSCCYHNYDARNWLRLLLHQRGLLSCFPMSHIYMRCIGLNWLALRFSNTKDEHQHDTWYLIVNLNKTHRSALLRSVPGMRPMPPVQFYIWGELGSRVTSWCSATIKDDDEHGSENRLCDSYESLLIWQCSHKVCLMDILYGYV